MDTSIEYVMIVIAAPREAGRDLARLLVREKAAACVQITSPVTSIYTWEGRTHEETEVLLFVKTASRKIAAIKELVSVRHPYQVPELIVLPITAGNETYFRWMDEVLNERPGK